MGTDRHIRFGVPAHCVSGVVAALFMAFAPTFWDNAIEAEVYASASAIMSTEMNLRPSLP